MKNILLLIPLILFFSCENDFDSINNSIFVRTFPNPCSGYIIVSGNLRTLNEIKIKLSGSDIEKSILSGPRGLFSTELNLMDLKPGSYNLQVFDGNKEIYSNIIINQKSN